MLQWALVYGQTFLNTLQALTAYRLDADQVGMVVDRGHDWPSSMQKDLERYGADMWMFRNRPEGKTTRALNSYMGDHRR